MQLLKSRYRRKIIIKSFTYIMLILLSIILLIPAFWMFSTALKEDGDVFLFPPVWIPEKLHWENFARALSFLPFGKYFINTSIITLFCVIGHLLSCSLVAYGFARLRARGREILFILVLSTLMLPAQVTMIPIFVLFKLLNWVDTFKPLIVPSFFGSAFFIFLLRQFYMTIPMEMSDAARMDGCGHFGIYSRIILPLSKPALATIAIFSFMWTWNDFMGPLIYLSSRDKLTVTLALSRFTGMYGMTAWNLLMGASLIAVLPCIVLFFFAQKYFIQGIVITGLKG